MTSKHSEGPWKAAYMTHADTGEPMTPAQIGEYVKNSVIKTAETSGHTRFLFVYTEDELGTVDICHVGNGPKGPANAQLIAQAPDLKKENEALLRAASEFATLLWGRREDMMRDEASQRGLDELDILNTKFHSLFDP
ncbi:MAG: hypothetical protein GY948_13320, partial [Alphaproteobacteria bacterium]|nr:hypothetical protein [Alphaproteobacteria bacterium]